MIKKMLRGEIRKRKSAWPAQDLEVMSELVCGHVKMDGVWRAAGTVLLYHALPDEVCVRMLMEQALFMGKMVLLPVVVGDELELRVYEGEDRLSAGAYGILEPIGDVYPEDQYANIDVAVIPGMAFDTCGHRLGRGKGYYDRLLSRMTNTYKIGVCYPFQLLEGVPFEKHDVKMNDVVSCEPLRR